MTPAPNETTAETIPGDPSHQNFEAAETELALLSSRGAGQPYLIAVKLNGEANTLHLRAYLKEPRDDFSWASIEKTPRRILELAQETNKGSAIASSVFDSGGIHPDAGIQSVLTRIINGEVADEVINSFDAATRRAFAAYLRRPGFGLFFDPTKNHDAWSEAEPLPHQIARSAANIADRLDLGATVAEPAYAVTETSQSDRLETSLSRDPGSEAELLFPQYSRHVVGTTDTQRAPLSGIVQTDAVAESLEYDPAQTETFRNQITARSFAVPDAMATVRTRGSAQKAFAEAVKTNYGFRCAITGIGVRDFLVASHIVPWSVDQSIRLDPSNGICLSLLVDRAFERGYLLIQDDLLIQIDWVKVGNDHSLRDELQRFDGQRLNLPAKEPPNTVYLQRRRSLLS